MLTLLLISNVCVLKHMFDVGDIIKATCPWSDRCWARTLLQCQRVTSQVDKVGSKLIERMEGDRPSNEEGG